MSCYLPWIFIDNVGNGWALGVTSLGKLTFSNVTFIPTNAVRQVPLTDVVNGNVYGISVTYDGVAPKLVSSGPLSIPTIGAFIPMSSAGRTFWLQVSSGRLFGSWKTAGGSTDPVVGQIYNYSFSNPPVGPPNLDNAGLPTGAAGGYLPPYSQPGGLSTQTLPAQQSGTPYSQEPSDDGLPTSDTGTPFELGMGMNTAGCGHWFQTYLLQFDTVACTPSCLICCPLCGFVQQIVTPASLIYSDPGLEHISS